MVSKKVYKVFVGGRDRENDRVFILRCFPKEDETAQVLYMDLVSVYGKAPNVELLFGMYPSPEAFFRSEPTWDLNFPKEGDRTFKDGKGV